MSWPIGQGFSGPTQAFLRDELSLFPVGADPVTFYRAVIFPLKARIDLAYYQNGSLFSDIGWIIRCFLVVVRLPSACLPDFLAQIRITQNAENPKSFQIPTWLESSFMNISKCSGLKHPILKSPWRASSITAVRPGTRKSPIAQDNRRDRNIVFSDGLPPH